MASKTAPATSSQMLQAALTSGIPAGQVTQSTANTKGTTLTATAPVTKSTAAPLPGAPSTGSAMVPLNSFAPFAGGAGVRPAASAGSGSAPLSSGSRSASNLLRELCDRKFIATPGSCLSPHLRPSPHPRLHPLHHRHLLPAHRQEAPHSHGRRIVSLMWPATRSTSARRPAYTVSLDRPLSQEKSRATPSIIFRRAKPISSPCPPMTMPVTKAHSQLKSARASSNGC